MAQFSASSLVNSKRSLEKALRAHRSPRFKQAAFGVGGITLVIGAIREFCKNWGAVKTQLEKAIDFLRKHDQGQLAGALALIVSFFDTIAKICPFIPGSGK